MRTPQFNGRFTPDYHSEAWRALIACSFWMRAGFIGASAAAIALLMLFAGEAGPVNALAGALAAGAFATFAWLRARDVLNRADSAETAGSTGPRLAGLRDRLESAASR